MLMFLDFTNLQHMGDFGSIHRPGIIVDYQNKSTSVPIATTRGIKRKMMQIFNKPGGTFIKKPKLAKPMEKMNLSKSPGKSKTVGCGSGPFTLQNTRFMIFSVHIESA